MYAGPKVLVIRPLVPAACADAPERNDEKFVAVNPFGYEPPFGEVFGHSYELFEVSNASLLHELRTRDVHPGVSSYVRNGRLEDQKRLLWHLPSFAH